MMKLHKKKKQNKQKNNAYKTTLQKLNQPQCNGVIHLPLKSYIFL